MTHRVMPLLQTPRLILREWQEDDRIPLAALCSDPLAMEYIPPRDRLDVARIHNPLTEHFGRSDGLGWWAIEAREHGRFIGFIGLSRVSFVAPFTPAVDMGWCLTPSEWGRGYAVEAAQAVSHYAFDVIGLSEIIAFTIPTNHRARAMMERLGMIHVSSEDFDDPRMDKNNPYQRQVLYRLKRSGSDKERAA